MLKVVIKSVVVISLIAFGFSLNFLIPVFMGMLGMSMPGMGMRGMGEMPPPAVKVMVLAEAPLDVQDEFIATVEPVQQVMVRAEVAGYVDAVHFQEGSMVEQGDLLFTINQNQYKALVEAREADFARAQAEVERAEKFLKRMSEANERSVSQSDMDTAESAHLQAVAGMKQAEANLNLANIDLAYAEIRAPISGRIGTAMVTKGNYVTSGSDAMAHIVQVDPVRVVFSLTDRTYLDLRRQVLDGREDVLVAQVRLPNGVTLPTIGRVEFVDNTMNMKTGTMAVRYLFENPGEMLVAGGYVNILLGSPNRPMGLRVPQRAVLVDADGSYVLTVNEEGLVGAARIDVGASVEEDVTVLSGLTVGDRVIVEGVQKAMPGMPATVMMMEPAK